MLGLLNTLAWAGGTLLGVAVFIACWEQWRHRSRPPPEPMPPPQRAISVDVDVEALPHEPTGDRLERLATLDSAFDRMVAGPSDPVSPSTSRAWVETRPMVSVAPVAEPESH